MFHDFPLVMMIGCRPAAPLAAGLHQGLDLSPGPVDLCVIEDARRFENPAVLERNEDAGAGKTIVGVTAELMLYPLDIVDLLWIDKDGAPPRRHALRPDADMPVGDNPVFVSTNQLPIPYRSVTQAQQ